MGGDVITHLQADPQVPDVALCGATGAGPMLRYRGRLEHLQHADCPACLRAALEREPRVPVAQAIRARLARL